jgi:hypothetical protein
VIEFYIEKVKNQYPIAFKTHLLFFITANFNHLKGKMEMACHRRINGSIWCAPMEIYDPPPYTPPSNYLAGNGSRSLENLIKWNNEYGTGFRTPAFEELREKPLKNDVSLRTLDLPESYSWYPGIDTTKYFVKKLG